MTNLVIFGQVKMTIFTSKWSKFDQFGGTMGDTRTKWVIFGDLSRVVFGIRVDSGRSRIESNLSKTTRGKSRQKSVILVDFGRKPAKMADFPGMGSGQDLVIWP